MTPETFNAWLARVHPDVLLTRMQKQWANRMERGSPYDGWIGGRHTGHTFVLNLWTEYNASKESK